MTTETDLPPLPEPVAVKYPDSGLRDDEHALRLWAAHGYDTGGEPLFSAEQLREATAPLQAKIEALQAEVERLQEIVRPRREDECLTLDHWRMRAYYLERNWARCSHACAVEQDKREQAEALAERLRAEVEEWKDAARCASEQQDSLFREARVLNERANKLAEALRLALDSRGVMLMTDPPQDAWKVRRVEEIGRALLSDQEDGK